MNNTNAQKDIILAGGCFWCIEAALRQKEGVVDVISGYAGGTIQNPTYEDVYMGRAGAREACLVIYDGDKVSTKELIQYFFSIIDPTDPDGQFADRGYSYTTAIYYNSQEEKEVVEHVLAELNASKKYDKPIATVVELRPDFYPAEEYHQEYAEKNPAHYKSYYRGSGREAYIEGNKEN